MFTAYRNRQDEMGRKLLSAEADIKSGTAKVSWHRNCKSAYVLKKVHPKSEEDQGCLPENKTCKEVLLIIPSLV